MRIPADSPTIKLMYQLRRLSLKEIDRTIASYQGPAPITSELRRFRNIINQSNPEDIFGHLNAKRLEKLVIGYADGTPLPKYLTGQGGSPDKNLFGKLREFFSANIHHVNPLAQNINAINADWDDNDLYTFHRTLNQFDTGSGSSKKGLINALFKEHLRKLHPGGTKVKEFPPLTQFDPELAAAEFWTNNIGNQSIVDEFKADPNTVTQKVKDILEQFHLDPKRFLKSVNKLPLEAQVQKVNRVLQVVDGGIKYLPKYGPVAAVGTAATVLGAATDAYGAATGAMDLQEEQSDRDQFKSWLQTTSGILGLASLKAPNPLTVGGSAITGGLLGVMEGVDANKARKREELDLQLGNTRTPVIPAEIKEYVPNTPFNRAKPLSSKEGV